ncbi:hypothetical protein CQW23_01369 [Capsicum baccatum]|uniref:Lipoxygenase domain-containing protein n=1 Tax=Capsicum baccatum TaxID=33114 RepID=A0A2G2XND3_CAPBA|nr:hypothetical protein CQW23_01369 [Capsicum baccatum]
MDRLLDNCSQGSEATFWIRFRDTSSRASVDSRYQQSELEVQISVMGYLVVFRGHEHRVAFWVPDSGRYTLLMSLRTLNMFCNETPKALYNYREDELLYLRGTRTRKLREWDRVYDYDVYNDFGDADSSPLLAQPFLGGYKEYPYLRTGRTGRPPSKTEDPQSESRLPQIESFDFSPLKLNDVLSNTQKAMAKLFSLQFATIGAVTLKEFNNFEDVLQVYEQELLVFISIQC